MNVFATKPVEQAIRDTDEPGHTLKKELSVLDLVVFGIGVIIGTGIFVLTGQQAAVNAGPAIVLSFLLAGAVCALAAVCYAEFASSVPVAGSAYTFSYATLGELVAWIIGWDLLLELALGAAVVARGWSAYAADLFDLPSWVAGDDAVPDFGAIFIVAVLVFVAVIGTKLTGRITGVMVAVKLAVVLFVIIVGAFYIETDNWKPFIPPSEPAVEQSGGEAPLLQVILGVTPSHFGFFGIVAAASVVFFAFIGFDIVATTAEETRNPQRDMPRGILGSLAICTVLYMAVSLVITGMKPYTELNTAAPLSEAFKDIGNDWMSRLISLGGIVGITTVILVLLLGQSRILFAMSRDGLLPARMAAVHPKFGTPYRITIVTGFVVAALAGFVPLSKLSELVSIGTLFAFVVVSAGVVILRRTRPDLPRSYRAPLVPWLPILSVLSCFYLMLNLPVDTWVRFILWMLVGFALYFLYGRHHSQLQGSRSRRAEATRATNPPRVSRGTGPD